MLISTQNLPQIKSDLFLLHTRLTNCQNGVYFTGIRIFNYLPEKIEKLSSNIPTFERELKKFLYWAPFNLLRNFMDGHLRKFFMSCI
jgi:hypothetical protein